MSIKIERDGRTIWDDDLAVQLRMGSGRVMAQDLIDHLELVAQVPTMYGEATSAAARGAINMIYVLAEQANINNVEELSVDCVTRIG